MTADSHPNYRNGFILLVCTGTRIGEVPGLMRKDIDNRNQVISVVGKGSKRRPLQLTGPLEPTWEALMAEMKTPPPARGGRAPHRGGYICPQYENWGRKMLNTLCAMALGDRPPVQVAGPQRHLDDLSNLRPFDRQGPTQWLD